MYILYVPLLPNKFFFSISMVNTKKIPTDTNQNTESVGISRDVNYTHLLCKRLQYVLSVNRIHTRVFFNVNQIQFISYD